MRTKNIIPCTNHAKAKQQFNEKKKEMQTGNGLTHSNKIESKMVCLYCGTQCVVLI